MPTITKHELARRDGGLGDPRLRLARAAPETLHQLIRKRGLDACSDLITSATPAQLSALLDLDLWRHRQPGRDEAFDADRFGEWLEALVDAGAPVAARTVAALDAHLVITGLSRYVRVLDPGTFEPTESSDDEPMDRHEMMHSETSGDAPECEVGGYLVRARRTDAWDAIVTLLVTLDAEHDRCFHALMTGCRRLSNSTPEIDGLDDLLREPAQHLHDAAEERARRQSRRGYATPADARAYLQMARLPQATPGAPNPIAAAYFRAVEDEEPIADGGEARCRPRALLEAPEGDARGGRLPHLKRMMERLLHRDETACLTRSRELAFLANTLLAGSSVQSRPFTPREAADAAACISNLGLECDTDLVEHDLMAAFEKGWSILHRDVSLYVGAQLSSILAGLECADADSARGLRALARQLAIHLEAGTPWLARDAADVLARFDMTAWIGVLGLLDECPILPATITAVLERRTTPVSPTAFQFISTTAQIGDIRLFMRALPGVLSR